jgi:hypothetical protein
MYRAVRYFYKIDVKDIGKNKNSDIYMFESISQTKFQAEIIPANDFSLVIWSRNSSSSASILLSVLPL